MLLHTNAGCAFPCWWGIVPGKTSWPEAEQFLSGEGIDTNPYSLHPWTVFYDGFDSIESIHTKFEFYERKGIVDVIHVYSEGFTNQPAFHEFWNESAPEAILAAYGRPSRVWVESAAESGEGNPTIMGFDVWLFYEPQGFFVYYSGSVKIEPMYRFCPTFDENGSDIYLLSMFFISPQSATPLTDLTQLAPRAVAPLELQEASGMTVEKFYELFKQKGKPACIETRRDIWR